MKNMSEVVMYRYPYLGTYVNSFRVDAGNRTLLIDSGLSSGRDGLRPWAREETALLCTHGHWDHIGNSRFLQEAGATVYASAGDLPYMTGFRWQWDIQFAQFAKDFDLPPARWTTYFSEVGEPLRPDVYLKDGDEWSIGNQTVKVLATPGHSKGSVCFLLEESGVLFTGDTLMGDGFFAGTPQCASPADYCKSMEKLMGLKVKMVYCDHNEPMSGELLAAKAQKGIDCMKRIRAHLEDFLNDYHGAEEQLLAEAVKHVCLAEGKKPGGGACVTVLAFLQDLLKDSAATSCLRTHTPL